ncbi:PilZ domain-containing protein [Parashewanella curva]|uniref:PilZ domain-containing protein n=1 Tax=Parashewanella curva TaxID=2338552 RepID=A0A3L8PV89_9GAMM|nr:PilZ domain-containing protein [Parashewanella curva]RLV59246.1 PilZ domain-containing protein [Parashewanella curva]
MSFDQVKAHLIEQLKPFLMEDDFEDLFEQLTADENSTDRFLLKMELNRLSTKCNRVIDLRDKSNLPCSTFVFDKQTHFLDEPAIASFKAAVSRYKNLYTLGAYEEVMAEHKRRLQTVQVEGIKESVKDEFIIPGIVLGTYYNRSEERMNYSVHITVSQIGKIDVEGSTLDLSVNGARIRLSAKHGLDTRKPLLIKLTELSDEYYYEDLQQGIEYQIIDIEEDNDAHILRLKRNTISEPLSKLLAKLIRDYKYRYKVDVNEVFSNTLGLGYESHLLPHLRHLPLFLNGTNNQLTHALLSPENQAIKSYFTDENDVCQLSHTLTEARLERHLAEPNAPQHHLLYCFTHQVKHTTYFYSATLYELNNHSLKNLFFKFGAKKNSWRVFKLSSIVIDKLRGYKAAIIPGDDSHYSPLVEQQLALYEHVIYLSDLTTEEGRVRYQNVQSQATPNLLKVFAQKKASISHIKFATLAFAERRQEPRYSFKTEISIQQDGQSIVGHSQDISTKGFQVIMPSPSSFNGEKLVWLGFPKLQSLAGKTQLHNLPYKLVMQRNNGQQLHLVAAQSKEAHTGVTFMNRLIIHNEEKLKQLSESGERTSELSDGLKNLVMRKLPATPFFIEKTQKSAKISAIAISSERDPVAELFAANSKESLTYDLTPLFENGFFKKHIIDFIRRTRSHQEMMHVDFYLHLIRRSRGTFGLKCVTKDSLTSQSEQIDFIKTGQQVGRFVALRMFVGVTGKPDLKYIQQERKYISQHAAHKAKQLEEKLWYTIGVGEIMDITAEVLHRDLGTNIS